MNDRDYDLVLYGATGFTGRLVLDHLVDSDDSADLRWAIAGRNEERLRRLLEESGAKADIVLADADDEASITAMAERTHVVCTTVGPYADHGTPLVAACAANGTDYCDLTGETHWVRRMIDQHQPAAAASGARILHCCGFDSIPSDIGVYYTQQQMMARHGTYATTVSGRFKAARGAPSGGTLATAVSMLDEAAEDPEVSALRRDPYALNPRGTEGPESPDHKLPGGEDVLGGWNAPFVMAEINTRVVRRSHALMGQPWGTEFSYDEAMLTGGGPVGLLTAAGIATGIAVGQVAMEIGPVRSAVKRLLPPPGTGPSPRMQAKGFWDFRFVATGPAGETLVTKVTGQGDPGYRSTSRMLGETALALAAGEAAVGGGSWTPASALGDALLQRLQDHAEVTFDVVG